MVKCKYCGKESEDWFCNSSCKSKHDKFVSADKIATEHEAAILIGLLLLCAVMGAAFMFSAKAGILMLIVIAIIPIVFPLVTPDTLKMMPMRSAIILLRVICITIIVISLFFLFFMTEDVHVI